MEDGPANEATDAPILDADTGGGGTSEGGTEEDAGGEETEKAEGDDAAPGN
jgi:hypothetical protein